MGRFTQSLFALSALSLLLTGCGLQTTAISNPTSANVTGNVFGGEQPVIGSHIHVMVASTSGYAGAAHALTLTGGAGTDSYGDYMLTGPGGDFDFPAASYTCSAGDGTHPPDSVYLLATGGNPGLSNPSTDNQALALVAVLGTCPGGGNFLSTVPTIIINEASTVAAAYALAQFASGPGNIGQSTTNTVHTTPGLQSAMAMASAIVSASGHTTGSSQDSTNNFAYHYPQTKLNALANITSACVNTDGSVHGESSPGAGDATACYNFFTAATPPNGGTAPTDTFTALLNIAHHPANNAGALFQLSGGVGAAFQPSIASQPTDWTLAANAVYLAGNYHFTNVIPGVSASSLLVGCGLGCDPSPHTSLPDGIFIVDATGHFEAEITKESAPFAATQQQINNIAGIAFSSGGGLIWANNNSTASNEATLNAPDQVSTLSVPIASATHDTYPVLGNFGGIAIDANNNPWVVSNDYGGLVSVSGAVQSGTSSGNFGLVGNAIDKNGNFWVSCSGTSAACEYDNTGTLLHSYAGIPSPVGVAVDNNNHAWFASNDTGSHNYQVFEVSTADGSIVSGSGYSQVAMGQVQNLALDSAGNAWVPSCNAGCPNATPNSFPDAVFVFAHGGTLVSPTHGFVDDEGTANTDFTQLATPFFGLKAPVSAGIDQSGNVWVTNASYSTDFPSVTIFIGAASPVVTPIQGNLLTPYSNPASLP